MRTSPLQMGLFYLEAWIQAFNTRSVSTDKSIIMGDGSSPFPSGMNITSTTEVDGFQIWSPNSGGAGASAIAVYLENATDALVFTENVIGSDDANAGNDGSGGSNGGDGNDGASGLDSSLTDCSSTRFGGGGGSNSCGGMNVQGGNGAAANCPYAYLSGSTVIGDDEPYGSDGSGPAPGLGGLGACDNAMFSWYSCGSCLLNTGCTGAGEVGTNGGDGAQGSGGSGSANSGLFGWHAVGNRFSE